MKRFLIIVTILGMTAVAAQAQTKGKTAQPPKETTAAQSPCGQSGAMANKASPEQVQKFLDATVQLRQDLFGKNAEYQALLRQANPDPKQAGDIAREIFDLRGKIAAEAVKQGFGPMPMMGMTGMTGMMGMGESGMGGCGGGGAGMMGGSGMMGGAGMKGGMDMMGGSGMGATAK